MGENLYKTWQWNKQTWLNMTGKKEQTGNKTEITRMWAKGRVIVYREVIDEQGNQVQPANQWGKLKNIK